MLSLAVAAVALIALFIGCNTYLRYQGWAARKMEPDALAQVLLPDMRVRMPDGPGPFPTILLFSGCDGPKDNMNRWADAFNAAGWGAIIVDSHTPRGYGDAQLWRLICAGQMLTGGERAGDVAVAIDIARARPEVDSEHIVLLGASHGGWSILDMLSLHASGRRPYNLIRWPESIERSEFAGVAGMILLYPYCGTGSQVARHGWRADIPALFLLVEGDTIADEEPCADVARGMAREGRDVSVLTLQGTTHGFDQAEKDPLSLLEFSPEATQQAETAVREFLGRIGAS
ncbi:dienelactone hydrolase family protein [Tropicimonas marinistellae]|uniref:dienelactone hydrolase family protein n=1 Tax=Tropicimonas marinistellae TaxID=1739787 RepID=UPI00082ABCB1|nr:hypothetical protein [Tropicimonas marinistellae]